MFYACFRFHFFCMLLPYSHVGSSHSSHHIDDGKGVDYEPQLLVRQKRVQQHKQQSRAQMAPDPSLIHPTPHSQGEGDKAGTREGRIKVPQERRGMCCVKEHRCKDEVQKIHCKSFTMHIAELLAMGTNKLKKQTPNSVVNIVERILPTVSSCLVQCCTTRPPLQAIASDTKSKSQPSQSHLRGDRSEGSNQIHHGLHLCTVLCTFGSIQIHNKWSTCTSYIVGWTVYN